MPQVSTQTKPPHADSGPWARYVLKLLEKADIRPHGKRPWDWQVHDRRLYRDIVLRGNLGLGEGYMKGWFDCQRLDQSLQRILTARLDENTFLPPLIFNWRNRLFNLQTRQRAWQVGKQHYDIGNALYQKMLDARMIYSCAYWKNAQSLDAAQEAKLTLIGEKLNLKPGMKVLDIGCGWGGAAAFLAERYGVAVDGVTISQRQHQWAQEKHPDARLNFRLMDYRDLQGTYDAIYSIGMFEHVGPKNYRRYFQKVKDLLKPEGVFLLHTIGKASPILAADPWISRYIFPNGMIPTQAAIVEAFKDFFRLEDWHNFGPDYDRTLMQWHKNVEAARWSLPKHYDRRFFRMWRYYLLSSAASFRARKLELWQLLLTHGELSPPQPPGLRAG
jgi:cyclopropane-fatty-acyl-phospholipid synthase